MDETRFDTLARSLGTAGSRRRALGGLLLGALGLLNRTESEDAIAHNLKAKCKKKSGDAKKKCLEKAKKHNAQHASESQPSESQPSESQPVVCPASCPVCQTCSNGACVPNRAVDDTACNGAGKCLNGVCNPPPTCGRVGTDPLCQTPAQCCSQQCETQNNFGCFYVQKGGPCVDDGDCASQNCVGYRCVQGALTVGTDCHPFFPDTCASGQCGCSSQTSCTCRTATCGGSSASCGQDVDCCGGFCCAGKCIPESCGTAACGANCTNNPNICCAPLTCQPDSPVTRACH